MKKILVPADFSENAANAIDYAIQLSEKVNAEIILLNVFTNVDTTFSSRKKFINDYNHSLAEGIGEQLKDLQQSILSKNEKARVSIRVYNGPVQDSILQCATDENADLIVMGTQGAGGLKKIFVGTTTAGTIGNARVPVLAIPTAAKWQGLKNILFASHHLEIKDKTFMAVVELAHLDAAVVHVMVFTDNDDTDVADYIEDGELLNLYHQQLPVKFKDTSFKTVHLEGEEFDETIKDYIKNNKIDMMIMTTHKRSFWQTIFNSSMTRDMSYQINIPLLAIPV